MEKILTIIPHVGKGGAEKLVSLLSNEFSKRKTNFFTVIFEDQIGYDIGGKVINIHIKGSKNIAVKMFNFVHRIIKLRRVINEIKPDIVCSFLEGPNLLNLMTSARPILSVHESRTKTKSLGAYKIIDDYIIRNFYKKAYRIVVVSKGLKRELVHQYHVPENIIKVIYNPIDIQSIDSLSQEPIEDEHAHIFENPVIINVGRLTTPKGQWHLMRAFKEVKKYLPNIQLVILGGEGELSNYLLDLKRKSYSSDDIHILGFNKNPYKYIAKSTLFVFPSLWEGFGISIVEALACGVPVVSSDCRYGPREILAPGSDINMETKETEFCEYGVLVPVCDGRLKDITDPLSSEELTMVETIIYMLQNEEKRMEYIQKSKRRAMDFEIKTIIREYEDAFFN